MNSEGTILNRTEIEKLFLEPSKHFSHKRIGRLTIRRRDIEESWGRNILRKLKESGVKMTQNEKKLYEECFGKVVQIKNFRKGDV